jgi:hypothetical protein
MSKDLIKVRNPSIYHGGSVVPRNRTPFEMADDIFCTYRNATTTPYQTYSPYSSTTSNLSDLVNKASIKCGEDGEYESRHIYKCHEDIHGNTYLLFKHDITASITHKRNSLGTLHVIGADGIEFEILFGTLVIPQGETVKDVQVFYDKVVIITDTNIWLGESGSRNFFSIPYVSYVQTTFKDGNVYILHDPKTEDIYDISKFDGNDIVPVTTTPLNDIITSSSMTVKDNRIELIYINTDCGFLTTSEYDLLEDKWNGFLLMNMHYEIIGVHDDSKKWYVYYESNTFPNRVGGLCIDFNFEKPPVVDGSECGTTEDISIIFDEIALPCPDISWALSSVNTNDWVEHSTHDIELRVQTSVTCLSGTNNDIQQGIALGTIEVPAGQYITLGWELEGVVETQDTGFDLASYSVNGDVIALIESQGDSGECEPFTVIKTGTTILPEGTNILQVLYDTVDYKYHTEEFGVRFTITSCGVLEEEPDVTSYYVCSSGLTTTITGSLNIGHFEGYFYLFGEQTLMTLTWDGNEWQLDTSGGSFSDPVSSDRNDPTGTTRQGLTVKKVSQW